VGEPCHGRNRKQKEDCFVAVIVAEWSYNLSILENMINRYVSKTYPCCHTYNEKAWITMCI